MAVETVAALDELTSPAANDEIGIWDVSAAQYMRITRANLVGGTITGGGTVATGGYTLTVPATGTAALLATAQTFSALQTFSAGVSLGNETLSTYDEGTFTPGLTLGGGSTGMTFSSRSGQYTRIGNLVFFELRMLLSAKGSSTGAAVITGLPFTVSSSSSPALSVSSFFALLGASVYSTAAVITSGGTTVTPYVATAAYTSMTAMADTHIGNSTQFYIAGCYRV